MPCQALLSTGSMRELRRPWCGTALIDLPLFAYVKYSNTEAGKSLERDPSQLFVLAILNRFLYQKRCFMVGLQNLAFNCLSLQA
jgi:hypothetical protein